MRWIGSEYEWLRGDTDDSRGSGIGSHFSLIPCTVDTGEFSFLFPPITWSASAYGHTTSSSSHSPTAPVLLSHHRLRPGYRFVTHFRSSFLASFRRIVSVSFRARLSYTDFRRVVLALVTRVPTSVGSFSFSALTYRLPSGRLRFTLRIPILVGTFPN